MADPSDELEDCLAFAWSYCERHGDVGAVSVLEMRLAGPRVMFSVAEATRYGCSLSGFLSRERDRREATLSRVLNRIMRQRSRERCIAAAGETETPAWSLDIHVLAMTLLVNGGINPVLLERHETKRDGRPSAFDRAVSDSAVSTTFEIRAGRICLTSGRIRTNDGVALYEPETSGGPLCIFVPGRSLSETTCTAMVGRPLSDVLSHPMLDPNDDVRTSCAISRITNDRGSLIIQMDDDRTTLVPPPPGIQPDWLEFDWTP